MALKIRLQRAGKKKKPFYKVVIADARAPRDGKYTERVGSYDPLLPQGAEKRIILDIERIQYWKSCGAQPTERVARLIKLVTAIN